MRVLLQLGSVVIYSDWTVLIVALGLTCFCLLAYAQIFIALLDNAKHAGKCARNCCAERVRKDNVAVLAATAAASIYLIGYLPYLIMSMGTELSEMAATYGVRNVWLTVGADV